MDDYKAIAIKLRDILDAFEQQRPLLSCQGQAMDGYSALANFQAIAKEARSLLLQEEE
ncbi:MAG: hypothetical protein WC479_07270 [Candidatus Izemoplasmatales bacterium]